MNKEEKIKYLNKKIENFVLEYLKKHRDRYVTEEELTRELSKQDFMDDGQMQEIILEAGVKEIQKIK